MGLQQDVVLRQIRDMERLLAQLLLRKDFSEIEETAESLAKRDGRIPESGNAFLDTLVRMADQGDVCAAEDLLLENIPAGDESYLELALIFYLHVSEMGAAGAKRAKDFSVERYYTEFVRIVQDMLQNGGAV